MRKASAWDKIENEHFFVRQNGLLYATPLLLVLILVELSDVIFAVDSIPAIFAVTTDPFIVYHRCRYYPLLPAPFSHR